DRIESLLRMDPVGLAMPYVVAPDLLVAFYRFIDGREGYQSLAARVGIGPACVLREHRLPAGEVAHAAVAEPPAAGLDVHVLGDGEFGVRLLDVLTVSDRIGGDFARIEQG